MVVQSIVIAKHGNSLQVSVNIGLEDPEFYYVPFKIPRFVLNSNNPETNPFSMQIEDKVYIIDSFDKLTIKDTQLTGIDDFIYCLTNDLI